MLRVLWYRDLQPSAPRIFNRFRKSIGFSYPGNAHIPAFADLASFSARTNCDRFNKLAWFMSTTRALIDFGRFRVICTVESDPQFGFFRSGDLDGIAI